LGVAQVVITLTNIDTDEVLVFNANLSDPGADATDFSLNVSTLSGQFNVVSEVIDTNGNTSSINTNLDRLNCNEDPEPEPEPEPEDPQPEDPEPIIPPIDGDEYPQCVETWTVDAIGMEIYNGADYSSTPQVIGHPDGGVYSINNGNGVVGRFSQPLKNIEGADFYVYNVNSNPSQNQVATVMVSDDGVSDFYAVGTISNTGNSGSPLMATGFDIESTGLDEINYVFVYVNGGEGSKFLIDAIGTGCGKQYYVSASSGGSDSVENTSEPERCEDEAPNAAPELFRIDVTDTTATLYFTPHGKPFNKIYISYWREGYPENEYGIEYDYTNDGGVTSYTINHLDPNTTYNFKVRLGNGCAPGPWGNIMQATTYGSAQYSQNDNGEVLGYTVTYKDYEQGYLADTGRNMMMSINISIVLIWAIIMLNLDYISDIFRKMFSKIKKISGTA
jgi:hypothetical protein